LDGWRVAAFCDSRYCREATGGAERTAPLVQDQIR